MRCNDVEHLLLDTSAEDLGEEQIEKLKQHISCCALCACLDDDLRKIRFHLQKMPAQSPSVEISERTRKLCHAQLDKPSIPKYIWAALAVLLVLTGILMLPFASEFMQGKSLSFPLVSTLILMIQNLVMLLVAPILIQRFRLRKKDVMNVMSSGPYQA